MYVLKRVMETRTMLVGFGVVLANQSTKLLEQDSFVTLCAAESVQTDVLAANPVLFNSLFN